MMRHHWLQDYSKILYLQQKNPWSELLSLPVVVGNLNTNVLGATATLATEGAWVADAVVPTKLQRFKQRDVFVMAISP